MTAQTSAAACRASHSSPRLSPPATPSCESAQRSAPHPSPLTPLFSGTQPVVQVCSAPAMARSPGQQLPLALNHPMSKGTAYLLLVVQTLVVVRERGLALGFARVAIAAGVDDVAGEDFLPEGKAAGWAWSQRSVLLAERDDVRMSMSQKNDKTYRRSTHSRTTLLPAECKKRSADRTGASLLWSLPDQTLQQPMVRFPKVMGYGHVIGSRLQARPRMTRPLTRRYIHGHIYT